MSSQQSAEEDDAARRQREMNLFAAMASGGSFIDTTTRTSKPDDSSAAMFADVAAAVVDTGTFAVSSSPHAHSSAACSNLEAAVAAITGEEASPPKPAVESPKYRPDMLSSMRPRTKQTSMQSERVLMPRPLFFGPILPPRVLRETRKAVADALKDNADGHETKTDDAPPSLDSLPKELRNVVGAIETFGFGLSVFPGDSTTDEDDEAYYRGTPYVSTYQPVWGDDARADRETRRAEQRSPPNATEEHSPIGKLATGEKTMEFGSPVTTAGQPTSDQGDYADAKTPAISNKSTRSADEPKAPDQHLFGMWARGEANDSFGADSVGSTDAKQVEEQSECDTSIDIKEEKQHMGTENSEQSIFSQWARGEDQDSGNAASGGSFISVASDFAIAPGFDRKFRPSHQSRHENDPDDDESSVVDSELKKQVGMNEHLNAALASLADEHPGTTGTAVAGSGVSESITAEESHVLLSQLCPTTSGGRPLSNMELTDGCVPLFACDDTPLPVEADLGIFEVKEEQIRSLERKKSQEIISKHAVPNFFGTIACPNPALNPDDMQSWNSRTAPVQRSAGGAGAPVHESARSPTSQSSTTHQHDVSSPMAGQGHQQPVTPKPHKGRHKTSSSPVSPSDPKASTKKNRSNRPPRFDSNTRFGWWNVDDDGVTPHVTPKENPTSPGEPLSPGHSKDDSEFPLQLPPVEHASSTLQPNTRLTPTPEELREENLPLSHLHSATATAGALPYLSDRPPSFRYIQIDAQTVSFCRDSKEIEPLFCTLAIYHVETLDGNNPRTAPVPNLQRCGRVTEVLNFDVVGHPDVEATCAGSLWPYATEEATENIDEIDDTTSSTPSFNAERLPESERTHGTRCGVFPIPSNLNVANLYAILIVHKVLSDVSDIGVYMKKQSDPKPSKSEIHKLGSKAERMSDRHGQVLMPFAFGVAPLLQAIGTDIPTIPSSRGVQIPLFRLVPGLGERPIIDHIMVMLYPRADHGNARVCELSGGTCMLVMRNFGFLGLHSVIHEKSSLARDRLVDFTGEVQMRRTAKNEESPDRISDDDDSPTYAVPPWRSQFVAEPTVNGGRSTVADCDHEQSDESVSRSPLYAKELGCVPITIAPSTDRPVSTPSQVRVQPNGRPGVNDADREPWFQTTFCNEMLCHPRIIHNCRGKTVAVKVELREMVWSEEHNAFLAFLPRSGPSIHNPRRGPFLVQEAFSSCAYKTYNPHFMDEFKVKLPLVLPQESVDQGGGACLMFFAYNIRLRPKKKWKHRLSGKRSKSKGGRDPQLNGLGVGVEEPGVAEGMEEDYPNVGFELLGCGFLPLASSKDSLCLIENGLHDVKLTYTARPPRNVGELSPETLIVSPKTNAAQEPEMETGTGVDVSSTCHTVSSLDTAEVSGRNVVDTDDVLEDTSLATESIVSGATATEGSTINSTLDGARLNTSLHSASSRRLANEKAVIARPATPTRPSEVATDMFEMTLQVRIVMHSSVHPQNSILNSFLCQAPGSPRPLSEKLMASSSSPWRLQREELKRCVHSTSSATSSSHEQNLIHPTAGICRTAEPYKSVHFLRSMSQLLRSCVAGTGEPSLAWANPSSPIPLRVHSFASLLHMLNSVSSYMTKGGITQIDGTEWNLPVFARVLSMVFDEQTMLVSSESSYGEEAFDLEDWSTTASRFPGDGATSDHLDEVRVSSSGSLAKKKTLSEGDGSRIGSGRRKKHVRSPHDNLWLFNEYAKRGGSRHNVLPDAPVPSGQFGVESSSKSGRHTESADEGRSLRQKSMTLPHSVALQTGENVSASGQSLARAGDAESRSSSSSGDMATGRRDELKIDSKSDFQNALKVALTSSQDGFVSHRPTSGAPRTSGTKAGLEMIDSGGQGIHNRRGWMTLPPLATIREDLFSGDADSPRVTGSDASKANEDSHASDNGTLLSNDTRKQDALDTELFVNESKRPPKQMRVPKKRLDDFNASKASTFPKSSDVASRPSLMSLPTTDEEIEATSTAFFDAVCKNLGYSGPEKNVQGGEEQRVGHAHHRKTRSRCSIDWTLPQTDSIIENQQQLEQLARHSDASGADVSPSRTFKDGGEILRKGNSQATHTRDSVERGSLCTEDTGITEGGPSHGSENPQMSMTSLIQEQRHTFCFPDFIDRIVGIVKLGKRDGKSAVRGRWYPYTYEVIVFQWVAFLVEQRRTGGKATKVGSSGSSVGSGSTIESTPRPRDSSGRDLTIAASRARGVAIACAPVLFEIIKKSIGWRIHSILRRAKPKGEEARRSALLATLDDSITSTLEQLITMLTDACIDCRNFESWEFRQISIDVNDSIVRFLRDMFAFLDTKTVHRLVMVYFSRFVTKEGKKWKERDSSIGLKSTWEICKLRLNAVTAFVRFPDFVRVCSPQMDSWQMDSWGSWPFTAPANATRNFFSNALRELECMAIPGYAATDIPVEGSSVEIPSLKPHWLAELAVDICLCGTEHVEHAIQHRAASLLHELFWSHGQEGKANGTSSALATMYVPLLLKLLGHISYMSCFTPKHLLRKDIMPCAVFVMEFAPVGLLRALWRKLCIRAEGKALHEKYGGIGGTHVSAAVEDSSGSESFLNTAESQRDSFKPDIFDMFSLLNLALSTFEYEGCDGHVEAENEAEANDQRAVWEREFLPAQESDGYNSPARRPTTIASRDRKEKFEQEIPRYSTSSSRKWHAHDGSVVVVNTGHQIVREMLAILRPSEGGSVGRSASHRLHLSRQLNDQVVNERPVANGIGNVSVNTENQEIDPNHILRFSLGDTVIFVRAATSLYLHSLALHQSDVVIIKTLNASVEIVKIFGIKIFLEAVGETLQHWMRVVSIHCGARRAEVRIEASEFLALILRLTWDTYGSFYRIRLPLIAVQTEVMERIVATAASRFYREQRRVGTVIQSMSNDSAEASLSPLWRTLDRLHHQPASQNVAFRSALIRLAEKMKKLFKAYIAAHALGILTRARSPLSPSNNGGSGVDPKLVNESSVLSQKSRISIHRIISASAGFSKQFLGLYRSSPQRDTVAHNEAVEDAFLAAADVFSPTELPSHRVAWLRRLADFHESRAKFAEEAACRFHIHMTFRQAARLHDCLWSSMPFLPWTGDENHMGGEGPTGEDDYYGANDDMEDLSADDYGLPEIEPHRQTEVSHSFRRIFYRVASSVRMQTGDWEIGGNKNLFYGVCFASEYQTISPWMSLREVEEGMVEEAETAGDLYLKAGIVESSRYAWSLATQFYSETFNYAKLAYVYKRLAKVVASQIPVVDSSNQLELSSPLGRFYRVWFHGGAPDELIGEEFVYRTAGSVKLEQFGRDLCEVVRSILPETTPIDLLLDDGRPEETNSRKKNARRPLGGSIEPVRIKVTPLRPLLKRANTIRGTPEWFYRYTDLTFDSTSAPPSTQHFGSGVSFRRMISSHGDETSDPVIPRHRKSFNASVFASGSVSATSGRSFRISRSGEVASRLRDESYEKNLSLVGGGEMIGVDSFSFMQPIDKDRHRATRDWLRAQSGNTAEKSLRVTQLQVEQSFPACVARQKVVHRTVFTQSPLEAGVDAVCSWCAVLFRTGVATNGLAVLGNQTDQGIGTAAAKVVADCIHSSRVKEIGLFLLDSEYDAAEGDPTGGSIIMTYTKLSPDEWQRLQKKLARAVVIFLELLHLLIARNRNLLLAVVDARKRRDGGSSVGGSLTRSVGVTTATKEAHPTVTSSPDSAGHRFGVASSLRSGRSSSFNDGMASSYDGGSKGHDDATQSVLNMSLAGSVPGPDKTDSAIAIQSELQRAYISMIKVLYPKISKVLTNETPRWLKTCYQEKSYFSTQGFRQTRLPMGEELFFFGADLPSHSDSPQKNSHHDRDVPVAIVNSFSPTNENDMGPPNEASHNDSFGGASSVISEPSKLSFPPKTHLQMYQSS